MLLPARVGDYTDFYASVHPRHQRGQHVPAGQSAAAQLQVDPDRLSRPRVVGGGQRHAGAPAARPDQGGRRRRAGLRPDAAARLRARGRRLRRAGQPAGRADRRSTRRRTTSSGSAWSTTGRRGTSRSGSTSRWARSWPRASRPRISPWVVTLDALAPFRCPAFARPDGDPRPLPYLHSERDEQRGGFDLRARGLAAQRADARAGAGAASAQRGTLPATCTGRWRR